MNFVSLFAGVGGFDVGLENAGMSCVGQSDIDKHTNAVREYHWPEMELIDDVRKITNRTGKGWKRYKRYSASTIELICGGFPCQDISVAGNRAGLSGSRSGLFFEAARIIKEINPRWVIIENVPGLLSSNGGRDMGTVLKTLGDIGYGWAYRMLDSQYFGLAQRRKRVFIVGCLGDTASAAKVLFDPESLPGHSAPGEETRQAEHVAGGPEGSIRKGGEPILNDISKPYRVYGTDAPGVTLQGEAGGMGAKTGLYLVPKVISFEGRGFSTSEEIHNTLQAGAHGYSEKTHGAVLALRDREGKEGGGKGLLIQEDISGTIAAINDQSIAYNVTFCDANGRRSDRPNGGLYVNEAERANTLTNSDTGKTLVSGYAVRKLTPIECERLQGFPDNWTRLGVVNGEQVEISDTQRYKQMGNAVSVPVAEWIAKRIMEVDSALK